MKSLLQEAQEKINQALELMEEKTSVAFDDTEKPKIIDGWKIKEHKSLGKVDLSKIKLFISKKQGNKYIIGTELKKFLDNKKVLNANILDYLLEHQELIPQEWKDGLVFFWGTIYRDSGGNLYVRCLYWNGAKWHWDYCWLDLNFYASHPAALAS